MKLGYVILLLLLAPPASGVREEGDETKPSVKLENINVDDLAKNEPMKLIFLLSYRGLFPNEDIAFDAEKKLIEMGKTDYKKIRNMILSVLQDEERNPLRQAALRWTKGDHRVNKIKNLELIKSHQYYWARRLLLDVLADIGTNEAIQDLLMLYHKKDFPVYKKNPLTHMTPDDLRSSFKGAAWNASTLRIMGQLKSEFSDPNCPEPRKKELEKFIKIIKKIFEEGP